MRLYEGSDGRYYTDRDLASNLETGVWRPCCYREGRAYEVVETADDELLVLVGVDEEGIDVCRDVVR